MYVEIKVWLNVIIIASKWKLYIHIWRRHNFQSITNINIFRIWIVNYKVLFVPNTIYWSTNRNRIVISNQIAIVIFDQWEIWKMRQEYNSSPIMLIPSWRSVPTQANRSQPHSSAILITNINSFLEIICRHYGNTHGKSNILTSGDLTSFMYQVARGMDYLSSKGVCIMYYYSIFFYTTRA